MPAFLLTFSCLCLDVQPYRKVCLETDFDYILGICSQDGEHHLRHDKGSGTHNDVTGHYSSIDILSVFLQLCDIVHHDDNRLRCWLSDTCNAETGHNDKKVPRDKYWKLYGTNPGQHYLIFTTSKDSDTLRFEEECTATSSTMDIFGKVSR